MPPTKGDSLQGVVVAGNITTLTGSTFVISKNSTVKTTDQTKFVNLATGKDVKPGDLKVGDFVVAKGTLNSDGSINALGVAIGVAPGQPEC